MPPRVYLDLDLHAGIGEATDEHSGGWPDPAEAGAQDGPAGLEVRALRQEVAHTHDIGEGTAGLDERRLDVAQALLSLGDHVVRDRHGRVVKAGRAGHVHPIAVDHGARVTDLLLEGRSTQDHSSLDHDPNARYADAICPILPRVRCDISRRMNR